jgi:pyrroloquinoline-quinone synthase
VTTPALTRYGDVERTIAEAVDRWFRRGPFFRALGAGALERPALRYFAVQYGHYSRHFPRILGAAIAAAEGDAAWWVPLADNLWDEAGRGVPGHTHQDLYRTFLVSVDPAADLEREPMGPGVRRAVDRFLRFFRRATPLDAVAGVGLGSELFAGTVMAWIRDGLAHPHYQTPRPLDLRFWHVHVTVDEPRHYALLRGILAAHGTPEELARMAAVGLKLARWEAAMYTDIWRESRGLV